MNKRQLALQKLVDQYGKRKAMDILALSSGYKETPPTIEEFISDPYYIGGQVEFYPVWKDLFKEVYPTPYSSPKLEIILTGCIGQGKTSAALGGTAYDVCKLLCLREPHSYFGLGRSKKISFVLLNKTQDVGKDVMYDQLMSWFSASEFFKKKLAEAPKSSTFPHEINIISGSRAGQVLGHDVAGAVLSELNFQTTVQNQAEDNYSTVRSRLESRFITAYQQKGSYPGRLWLDSSRDADNSFMETHAEKVKDDPLVKISDKAYWEVHGHKPGLYCGEKFQVFVGNKDRDPTVIETEEDLQGLNLTEIIEVPIEHKQSFTIDLAKALRDIAGRGLVTEMTFIQSTEQIGSSMRRTNYVNKDLIVLDFYDDQQLIHTLDVSGLLDEFPGAQWYVHFDLGLKHDAAAIAFSAIYDWRKALKYDELTGKPYETKEPLFVTPVLFRIKNKTGSETPIYKLKQLILDCKRNGIGFAQISCDGYQSANLMQDLTLAGFEVKLVSVDRHKDAYITLKHAIMENRWAGPRHEVLQQELIQLKDLGKKVDHPKNGSKDCSDAVSGSISEASKNTDSVQAAQNMEDYFEQVEADEHGSVYDLISQIGKNS